MFKKLISLVCVIAIVLSFASICVSADEVEVGTSLEINDDYSAFSELAFVKDRVTYIPLRLVYPISNDTTNKTGLELQWDNQQETVRLIYGETTGEEYIMDADGYGTTPFSGTRYCVDIMFNSNPQYGAKAYLTVLDYTKENGVMSIGGYDDQMELNDLVYVKTVGDGERLFVSTRDVALLSEYLHINDSYTVKLK